MKGFLTCGGLVALILSVLSCAVPTDKETTLSQTQRESVVGQMATEATDKTFSAPSATKIQTAEGMAIEIPATELADRHTRSEGREQSDSAASGEWTSSEKLAWGLVMLLGGFGLILMAVGAMMIVSLLKKSAAVRAAWAFGDNAVAQIVNNIRSQASTSNDPNVTGVLNALAGDAERVRADMNRPK
jgi:hypothetical protein